MSKLCKKQRFHCAGAWIGCAVVLLTLAIFGTTIFLAREILFRSLRDQIARRDANFLYALSAGQSLGDESGTDTVDTPADQFAAVLRISQQRQLRHLLALRLFDPDGKEAAPPFPLNVTDAQLSPADLRAMRALTPLCHFESNGRLDEIFWLEPGEAGESKNQVVPIQTVLVPLHSAHDAQLRGIAQFILNGESLAKEYRDLRQRLDREAWIAFLVLGGVVSAGLSLGFYRLQHVNHLLEERTRSLLRANQELSMAAKTSAMGTVAAHLIHGLRNPLFGLHNFMANRESALAENGDVEWELALSSTRRMQELVDEIVRVLREETHTTQYQISLDELVDLLKAKLQPAAGERGVRLKFETSTDGVLTNRDANLISLIIENVAQNGIQATHSGGTVRIRFAAEGESVTCKVMDEGPGLTESARQTLFTPGASHKAGGSGIGLCISKQLAHHVGASLELSASSAAGTTFILRLPADLFAADNLESLANA